MRCHIVNFLAFTLFFIRYTLAAEVNVTAVRIFVECVTNLTTNFDYVVEENGSLILQAAFNQSSPTQKQDENAAFNCLARVNYQFYLAIDGNESEEYKLHDSRPLTRGSVEDIINSGLVPPAPPHWSQAGSRTGNSLTDNDIIEIFWYKEKPCIFPAKKKMCQIRRKLDQSLWPLCLALMIPVFDKFHFS